MKMTFLGSAAKYDFFLIYLGLPSEILQFSGVWPPQIPFFFLLGILPAPRSGSGKNPKKNWGFAAVRPPKIAKFQREPLGKS